MKSKVSHADILRALEGANGHRTAAAAKLGISTRAMAYQMVEMRRDGMEIPVVGFQQAPNIAGATVSPISDPDLPIEELRNRRKNEYQRISQHWESSKLIHINLSDPKPFGIVFFGDPHIDDPGCNFPALERDIAVVQKTEGLFAATPGDLANSWVGRLAVLYANQETTANDAWRLSEWFVKELIGKWLYIVGGNHDMWNGSGRSNPLDWICRQARAIYQPSQVRIALHCAKREIRINARHDFRGHSEINPAHGAMKAIQRGFRDNVATAGHWHKSGYGVLKDAATGMICHAIQVASYKIWDDFARTKGFADEHISPCACIVVDPRASEASLIQMFWEAEAAADFLTYKRRKKSA